MSAIEMFLIALSFLGLCLCLSLYVVGQKLEKCRKQEREEQEEQQQWLERDMKL